MSTGCLGLFALRQSNHGVLNTFLIIVGLSVGLFCTGCGRSEELDKDSSFKTPSGPIEMKLKWPLKERIVKSYETTYSAESAISDRKGRKEEGLLGSEYGLTVVKANSRGGHELELDLLSTRLKVTMGDLAIDCDTKAQLSTPKDSTNAGLAKMIQRAIGAKVLLILDASNQVRRVDGLDLVKKRMEAGGTSDLEKNFENFYSEGSVREMVQSDNLPDHAIQPGDTWSVEKKEPMGNMGTTVLSYHFSFANWEKHGKRTCARLEYTGTIITKPGTNSDANMTMEADGTLSGVSWFDPELGLVLESSANQDSKMIVSIPNKTERRTTTNFIHQATLVKLKSVK